MPDPVLIPLVNANEPDALLAALHVQEGQYIQAGQLIATFETTKAAQDLHAGREGYIRGITAQPGDTLTAGMQLCWLAGSLDEALPQNEPDSQPVTTYAPSSIRLTSKARKLAEELGIDLSIIPADDRLLTEADVRALHSQPTSPATVMPFDPLALIIYGAGGHGRSLIELVQAMHTHRLIGIVDDGLAQGSLVLGLPVLGGADALPGLIQQGVRLAVNAVGGIGGITTRVRVFERLHAAGFSCPAVIHPSAVIEPSASLSAGVQIFPLAYVGSLAQIGFGCIVNTGAIVSHDCVLGAYANLSPGATLAGAVTVGERALVGMRATVNLGVQIGAGARIGNGATVKADVPEGAIVPAGSIWPRPGSPQGG